MNRAARNPAGLLDQFHDAHGCRRLTAAGLTDQRKDFSFFDIKADMVYRVYRSGRSLKLYA